MSKFLNYINEKDDYDFDNIINTIKKDCQPFLKDWKTKYKQENLWSGRRKIIRFDKRKIRKNRTPRDTPIELHKEMDKWFHKKFGVKARSESLFCTFNEKDSQLYGEPHIIFPIGKYKMISSNKIEDIYFVLETLFTNAIGTNTFLWDNVTNKQEFINNLIETLEEGNYKINQHNDSEQMLVCNEYYIMYPPLDVMKFIDFKHRLIYDT